MSKSMAEWLATNPSREEMVKMLERYDKYMNSVDVLVSYTRAKLPIPDDIWCPYEGSDLEVCWELTRHKERANK